MMNIRRIFAVRVLKAQQNSLRIDNFRIYAKSSNYGENKSQCGGDEVIYVQNYLIYQEYV